MAAVIFSVTKRVVVTAILAGGATLLTVLAQKAANGFTDSAGSAA